MSHVPHIRFLDSHRADFETLPSELIQALQGDGWSMKVAKVGDHSMLWRAWSIAAFEAGAVRERGLEIELMDQALDLSLRLVTNWEHELLGGDKRIWLNVTTYQTGFFWGNDIDSERYSNRLLKIAIKLYDVFQPSFGWVDFNYGVFTDHEDVEEARLPALYWANLFGPRWVNRLGKVWLKSAPGWKTELLSDGGMLYALAPGLGLTSKHVDTDLVSEYFNNAKVR
jgi:hypothetical protein